MTEIYGTFGPSCGSRPVLEAMLAEGLTGMRLNLSHTSLRESSSRIENYRAACAAVGRPAELMIDLHGPQQRTGWMKKPLRLRMDDNVILRARGTTDIFPVVKVPPAVLRALEEGDCITFHDQGVQVAVVRELEPTCPDETEGMYAAEGITEGMTQEAITSGEDGPEDILQAEISSAGCGMTGMPYAETSAAGNETADIPYAENSSSVEKATGILYAETSASGDETEDMLQTEKTPAADDTDRYRRFLCRVIRGDVVRSQQTIRIEGKEVYGDVVHRMDDENLELAKDYGVTSVMQPFVRSGEDIREVREALRVRGLDSLRIFAKIETLEGVANLDSIIREADEIVIARGDLGNAMPLWELPRVQKEIAAKCRAAGRPFLTVTQMLDSMTHRPTPTRAEVSDIFNAVLDGSSAVMVTGETAVGEYPAEVIRYLARTVKEAEDYRCRL